MIQFVADDITVLIIVNLIESVDVAVYPIAVVGVCVSIHLEFSPLESAVGKQSIDAVVGRHLPVSAPFHVSHVVVRAGNVVADNVKNSFIYSSSKLVTATGLENVIIVETEDAVMVCGKDSAQDVKTIYERLKKKDDSAAILHKTVIRPWGTYTCLSEGEGYLTKVIRVNPGQKLSVQSHNYRSEHWVVLEGNALVVLDGKEHRLCQGQSIDIPVYAKHSLQNPSDEPLKIIEVQKGSYLSEDDIIRYEDIYGRV